MHLGSRSGRPRKSEVRTPDSHACDFYPLGTGRESVPVSDLRCRMTNAGCRMPDAGRIQSAFNPSSVIRHPKVIPGLFLRNADENDFSGDQGSRRAGKARGLARASRFPGDHARDVSQCLESPDLRVVDRRVPHRADHERGQSRSVQMGRKHDGGGPREIRGGGGGLGWREVDPESPHRSAT